MAFGVEFHNTQGLLNVGAGKGSRQGGRRLVTLPESRHPCAGNYRDALPMMRDLMAILSIAEPRK